MKLALAFSHKGKNGVTASGAALVAALAGRGHEVCVVHRPGAWIGDQALGARTLPLDMGKRVLNYGAARAGFSHLAAWGAQVFYSAGTGADRLGALYEVWTPLPTAAKAAARVWHYHWRFHDAVIAPAQATIDWYVARGMMRRDRAHLIPNFVDPAPPGDRAAARADLGLAADAFVLGMVGSVDRRKAQSRAVVMQRALAARGVRAVFVAIGGGAEGEEGRALLAAARDAGAEVRQPGRRHDARALLPAFDAFLSTSRDEQDPVAVIEALAAGLPIVSTPVGSVPAYLHNGAGGHLWTPEAPDAAADYLVRIARDPAFAAVQSAAARAIYDAERAPGPLLSRFEALMARLARV